jgi:phage terminase large subunit-like protein
MPGSKLILEQLILEKRIRLRRSPVLISAMMSATTENDPFGNFWFSKRKAVNRIDALVALAMAVGAATAKSDGGKSFWE